MFGYALVFTSILSIVSPNAAQAAEPTVAPVRLAYGASVVELSKAAIDRLHASSRTEIAVLREAGLGADSILIAVDTGKATLGISGNSWTNLLEVVTENKLTMKNLATIGHRELGIDKIQILTYPGGPKELTKEQLRKLLTGEVKNWVSINGDDVPVQITAPINTPATQKMISKEVLGGAELYRRGIHLSPNFAEDVKFIAHTKGAIGYGSALMDISSVNRPKHPPISRTVTAVYLEKPSQENEELMKAYSAVLSR